MWCFLRLTVLKDGSTLAAFLDGDVSNRHRETLVCQTANLRVNEGIKACTGHIDDLPLLVSKLVETDVPAEPQPELLVAIRSRIAALKQFGGFVASVLPLGMELYPFQQRGSEFLTTCKRGILGDDMGLGKTVQVLAALPRGASVQVVCPVSLMYTWARMFEAWRPDFNISVQRKAIGVVEGMTAITSYNGMVKREEVDFTDPTRGFNYSYAAVPGSYLVLDEFHYMKNLETQRTKNGLDLISENDWHSIWGLTGTPILNRPTELWSLLSVLGVETQIFGSYKNFRDLFKYGRGSDGRDFFGMPDPIVKDLLQPVMLCRKKEEVLPDLPKKTYQIEKMEKSELNASVMALLDQVQLQIELQQIFEEDEDGLPRFTRAAMAMLSTARKNLATAKIGRMLEICEEYEEEDVPLVVFSAHKAPIEAIKHRPGWAVIYGDTDPEERNEIVERFQRGVYKGIGCTIRAASLGITLTHASHLLMVDLEWTPALNKQAEDRVCRIGQTLPCVIKCLVADHEIDTMVWDKLFLKQQLIEATIVHQPNRERSLLGDFEKLEPLIALTVARLEQERQKRKWI